MTNTNINRKGYKETKIGWIPQEWERVKLEELWSFSKGKVIANYVNRPYSLCRENGIMPE